MHIRLHVNVDHVATLRQARGVDYPDPVKAALLAEEAGADGITVHLREDRRHIQDNDVRRLKGALKTFLNLEMAATDEMAEIACEVKPDLVTLVPEKRDERTTEGGLDVLAQQEAVSSVCQRLAKAHVPVNLFIDPELEQIKAAAQLHVHGLEFHTGEYANTAKADRPRQLKKLASAGLYCLVNMPTIAIAAGHGLTLDNVGPLIETVPGVTELNIGHALVADAIMDGMQQTIRNYRDVMLRAAAKARRS